MRHYISFSGPGGRHYFQPGRGRRRFGGQEPPDSARLSEDTRHCRLCRRQCPLSDPGCDNGREPAAGRKAPGE